MSYRSPSSSSCSLWLILSQQYLATLSPSIHLAESCCCAASLLFILTNRSWATGVHPGRFAWAYNIIWKQGLWGTVIAHFAQDCFGCAGSLCFHVNFRILFCFCAECQWNHNRDWIWTCRLLFAIFPWNSLQFLYWSLSRLFTIILWHSLSLYSFVLKFILSDISKAILLQYHFPSFQFQFHVSLWTTCFSCRQLIFKF